MGCGQAAEKEVRLRWVIFLILFFGMAYAELPIPEWVVQECASRALFCEPVPEPAEIERVDFLEVDSHSTYLELTCSLEALSPKVRKYIAVRQTHWFGSENGIEGPVSGYPSHISREKRGLKTAIADFLVHFPEWNLERQVDEEEGLTLLKRIAKGEIEEKIDEAIRQKIILCTGPSFGNRELLIRMTERDMGRIPYKKIFLTTADVRNLDVEFCGKKPVCELIIQREKYVDCLNCYISTLRNAANDPECADDDIVIFKHESVVLNDWNLFRKAIGKIVQGKNLVIRHFEGRDLCAPVHVPDPCIITVAALREAFRKEEHPYFSEQDMQGPEFYLTYRILFEVPNKHLIPFFHCFHKDTQLGFYHVPSVEFTEFGYWDKKDYYEIYK